MLLFTFFQLIQLINKLSLTESQLSHLGDVQIKFNEKLYENFPEATKKQKIHHNLHTEDLIRQHGVPIGYTTGNVFKYTRSHETKSRKGRKFI